MLRKKERLSREEFNRFFSVGRRYHSPLFQLIYAPCDAFHASVVVPKKVIKLAVGRNKLRRRAYDTLRHIKSEKGVVGVFIFIAKPPAAQASFDDIKATVKMLVAQT